MKLRALVLSVTIVAAFVGIVARLEAMKPRPAEPDLHERATPGMRLGSTDRAAAIRGTVTAPVKGVRIGTTGCEDIIAFTFPINTIAGPELVQKAYASPTYRVIDVYRGDAHDQLPYLERVASMFLARIATVWVGSGPADWYFARIAVPSGCHVDKDASIDWAMALVELSAGR